VKNRNELLFFMDVNALINVAVLDLLITTKLDQEVRTGVQATVFQDLPDRQRRLGRRLWLVIQEVRDGVNCVLRLLRLGRAHADLLIEFLRTAPGALFKRARLCHHRQFFVHHKADSKPDWPITSTILYNL
jgi:hypothetical protein